MPTTIPQIDLTGKGNFSMNIEILNRDDNDFRSVESGDIRKNFSTD